jgi:nickel/cobalt exporter
MTQFTDLVTQSAGHAWLFIPSAILLGALHGLEPGHSKTMMAAFIVAVRGTIAQAALLAISATVSHTAIVWVFAIAALTWGKHWNAEASEPYFQILSGVIIVGMALWMLYRTWRDRQRGRIAAQGHDHSHDHHHDETKRIDTGHGVVELSVFEDGVPPQFRLKYLDHRGQCLQPKTGETVSVETTREDGTRQVFAFADKGSYLESTSEIPEPHQFKATLSIVHGGHAHAYDIDYVEHDHAHEPMHEGLSVDDPDYQDAHARAHAREIKQRFAGGTATTKQVILFGLTGGLLPCPAAVTVLLLCLQLQRFWLGIVLVLCFSIGLALTLLMSGIVAVWGTRHVARRWKTLDALTGRAPYFASILIICVGLYVGLRGILSLGH